MWFHNYQWVTLNKQQDYEMLSIVPLPLLPGVGAQQGREDEPSLYFG
jgi:hypothetical protein